MIRIPLVAVALSALSLVACKEGPPPDACVVRCQYAKRCNLSTADGFGPDCAETCKTMRAAGRLNEGKQSPEDLAAEMKCMGMPGCDQSSACLEQMPSRQRLRKLLDEAN